MPNLTESLAWFLRAREVIPGVSQTASKRPWNFAPGAYPVYLARGKGSRVWDVDGNEYVDFVSALGPVILGYSDDGVNEAIRRQLEDGICFSVMHALEVEAAERLRELVPCAEMTRFFKTGAECCNAAVRVARAFTCKDVVLSSGYHGWLDWWTVSANERGVPACLKDTIDTFALNDGEALARLVKEHAGRIACIFLVPSDFEEPKKEFLELLFKLAREQGALVAFDEIVTGFRLALGGAQEYYGHTPDLATFAKAMSNGMPLAALCGKREYMEIAGDLLISSTYGGETLSLAAALATLDKLERDDCVAHFHRLGGMLKTGMKEAADRAGVPLAVNGAAPISNFKFLSDDPAVESHVQHYLLQEMAARGYLFRRGGFNLITASHTEADVSGALAAMDEVFAEMARLMKDGTLADHLVVDEQLARGKAFSPR